MSSNPSVRVRPSQSVPEPLVTRTRLLKPSLRVVAKNWWPAVVWLGIIRLESTDVASSANTSGLLYAVLSFLFPHISAYWVEHINEVLRKTGHFAGYGILGALVFMALRNANRDLVTPQLLRRWGTYLHDFWRMEWVLLGLGVTVITAALDEIHQSFIPSRTGRWQDVVLDTGGAVVIQIIIYVLSLRALDRRRDRLGQAKLTPISWK